MSILPRYVVLEVVKVFLIAVTALTMLFLIIGVVKEAADKNLPMAHVVRLIPYILPEELRFAVPVALLFGLHERVFARMAGANEIVAIKALGISPMTLLWPVFILAFLLSLCTVWLNDVAVSWGRNGMQQVVIGAVEDIVYGMLRTRHSYSSPFVSIYVKRVEGRKLIGPTFSMPARDGSPGVTITAEWAELHADQSEQMLRIFLHNGTYDFAGKVKGEFPQEEKAIPLADASRAHAASDVPSNLALRVIQEETGRQQTAIETYDQQMAADTAFHLTCGNFDYLAASQWQAVRDEHDVLWARLYRLRAEPHRRWSGGFSCLCFAWIGVPMAIRLRNRDFLTSFFLCFSPILVVYYPLLIAGTDGAKNGALPGCAVWAGNLLLLLWGTWMLRKVVRY